MITTELEQYRQRILNIIRPQFVDRRVIAARLGRRAFGGPGPQALIAHARCRRGQFERVSVLDNQPLCTSLEPFIKPPLTPRHFLCQIAHPSGALKGTLSDPRHFSKTLGLRRSSGRCCIAIP